MLKTRRAWSVAAGIVLVAAGLAGCGDDDDAGVGSESASGEASGSEAAEFDGEFPIGVVGSLTGPFAPLGQPMQTALNVAAEEINANGGMGGKKVVLDVRDDGSAPDRATDIVREFIRDDDMQVIIGPNSTGMCEAARQLTEPAGRLLYCQSGAPFEYSPLFFAAQAPPQLSLFAVPLQYFKEQGWERIGVIQTADPSGEIYHVMDDLAPKWGLEVVERETFQSGDTDVTAQLTKLRSANPDVIFAGVTGANLIPIVKGVQQLGLDQPVFASLGSVLFAVADLAAESLPSGGLFSGGTWAYLPEELPDDHPNVERIKTFHEAYEDASGGMPPDLIPLASADAIHLVDQAVDAGHETGPEIAEYLEGVKDYQGLLGEYSFSPDDHRGADLSTVIFRWTPEGTFTVVDEIDGDTAKETMMTEGG